MEKQTNLNPVICKVYFTEINKIASLTTSNDLNYRTLNLKPNETSNDVYFTPSTAVVSSQHSDSDEGSIYNNVLQLKYPGDGLNMPGYLKAINNKLGVIHYIYNNNTVKTFGTTDNPAICNMDYDGSNGAYDVVFSQKDSLSPLNLSV